MPAQAGIHDVRQKSSRFFVLKRLAAEKLIN